MQLEIGSTYQGKVKRITNYGAFIAIQPDAAAPEWYTFQKSPIGLFMTFTNLYRKGKKYR